MYMWGFLKISGKKKAFLGQNASKWKADVYTIASTLKMPISPFLVKTGVLVGYFRYIYLLDMGLCWLDKACKSSLLASVLI